MDGRIPKKRRVLAELSESPVKNPATAAPRSNSASSPSIMEEFRPKKAAKKNSNSSSSNGKHADGPKRGQSKNRGKKKKAPEPPKGDKDALCGVDLSDKSVTARDVCTTLIQLLPAGATKNDAVAKKLTKSFPLVIQQLETNSSALARANLSEGKRRPIAFHNSTIYMPEDSFSLVLQHLDGRALVKVGVTIRDVFRRSSFSCADFSPFAFRHRWSASRGCHPRAMSSCGGSVPSVCHSCFDI